jgi:protocatechuate 3,4-dioxygenase beta subunit
MSQEQRRLFFGRRELLKMGAGTVGLFTNGLVNTIFDRVPAAKAAANVRSCVVRPEQTEGPYFVDEKLNRSDIRADPSDRSLRPGMPLRLEFQVSRVSGAACPPLGGAIVDVWQCDAQGVYSDVRDPRFDTRGKKFLRGYQQTDRNGRATFQTIYPGWYEGRAVHIHFKIRTAGGSRAQEFTSQLYFDEAINDRVFNEAPYNARQGRRTTNDADFIFRRGGKDLLLKLVQNEHGYNADFSIALKDI